MPCFTKPNAWIALTAAVMRTTKIRLGTLLTPLSRMRPWKLASEKATLDNLSGGRVILSVGLGAIETGFEAFGKEIIELWEEAGATWWIESLWEASRDTAGREMVQYRLRQGPPAFH
jgi:alkanesulfonate monooxygenase SsuD/methylene tetrahydromethanopterin reductase-like flavin-dependent oxidoreductase (luciferase family)